MYSRRASVMVLYKQPGQQSQIVVGATSRMKIRARLPIQDQTGDL